MADEPFDLEDFVADPSRALVTPLCRDLNTTSQPCAPSITLKTTLRPKGEPNPTVTIRYEVFAGDGRFCVNGSDEPELSDPGNPYLIDSTKTISTPVTFCRGDSLTIPLRVHVSKADGSFTHPPLRTTIVLDAMKATHIPASKALAGEAEGSMSVSLYLFVPAEAGAVRSVKFSIARHSNVWFETEDGLAKNIRVKDIEGGQVVEQVRLRRGAGADPGAALRITASLCDGNGDVLAMRYCSLRLEG